jgi:hypothetical protein
MKYYFVAQFQLADAGGSRVSYVGKHRLLTQKLETTSVIIFVNPAITEIISL